MATKTQRAQRFGGAMTAYASSPPFDISYLMNFYDWASIQGQSQIIDAGGGTGAVAKQLARQFTNLQVLVQDDSSVVNGAESTVPENLKPRVKFMADNIFLPQTVAADVYILRWVLHNWADKYAIKILQALVPVLKSGTRV